MDTTLEALGFSPRFQALFAPHHADLVVPARVIRSDRGSVLVATDRGEVRAKPAITLLKEAEAGGDLPAVGDWVALLDAPDLDVPQVLAVLPRAGAVTRGQSGGTSNAQVLAANVDVVFVVHPIAEEPNLRRIERELTLAWESGALPVVVLSKADLAADPGSAREAVASVALGVDVLVTSSLLGDGVAEVEARLEGRKTAVLLGPSGAGKSTLVNALLGEQRMATRDVRSADGRGRHTTVTRELMVLPGGGLLIDTPGLRAVGLSGSDEGIASAFPEVERVAEDCRFRDCTHTEEPGCAVLAAVEAGTIDAGRVASYHKLRREAEVAAMKTDARLRAEEVRKWKIIQKSARAYYVDKGRG